MNTTRYTMWHVSRTNDIGNNSKEDDIEEENEGNQDTNDVLGACEWELLSQMGPLCTMVLDELNMLRRHEFDINNNWDHSTIPPFLHTNETQFIYDNKTSGYFNTVRMVSTNPHDTLSPKQD